MIPQKYIDQLTQVAQLKKKNSRQALLKSLYKDPKFIKALKIICKNTIACKVPLSKTEKRKLCRHAKAITHIAKTKSSARNIVLQNGGGFLSVLVPLVTTLLGEVLNGKNPKMEDGA